MRSPRGDALGLGLLAAALAVFLAESWAIQPHLDDAFISYRYARNLVEGLGLVYNPGAYVEGYTNLLWTLLVAAGMGMGLDAPVAAHGLGVASGVAMLVATWLLGRTGLAPERAWLAGLAPWIVLSSTVFARWSISGMESPLFTAWVTAAFAASARGRPGWATAWLSLATLTRPEGVLAAGVVYGFQLAARRSEGASALRWPLVYAGVLAALTLFRLAYYGALLPNTFHAKVGGVPIVWGLVHVWTFLTAGAGLLLLPAGLAAWWDARWRPLAAYALLVSAWVIAIGGDVFGHRFLLPYLPGLAVLAVRGAALGYDRRDSLGIGLSALVASAAIQFTFAELSVPAIAALVTLCMAWVEALRSGRRWLVPAALGLVAAVGLGLLARGSGSPVDGARALFAESARRVAVAESRRKDAFFVRLGLRTATLLSSREEPVRLVAAGAIGALGYYGRFDVLDIFGLTEPAIAHTRREEGRVMRFPGHQRSNADFVFAARPDYIFVARRIGAAEAQEPQLYPAFYDIWAHPELDRAYVWDERVKGYRRRRGVDP